VADSERELLWLRRARDLAHELTREQDPGALIPRILDQAIAMTEAERGFLVLVTPREGGFHASVRAARGFDRAALSASGEDVSRTAVERVLGKGAGLVTTRGEDADVLDASSVVSRRVRSIASVPLCLRGEIRGALYLDHRFVPDAFRPGDLPALQIFADQAALALETAELSQDRDRAVDRLGEALREVERLERLRDERPEAETPAALAGADPERLRFGGLVGGSRRMQALYRDVERAARSWQPVLVQGESGTGKELVAREIHARGARAGEPLVAEGCAAIPEELLESELFGHVAGAFSGAVAARDGLFVEAGAGTLLLDEVAEMSPSLQAKLLRVLQEGAVRPLGGGETREVRCRVVSTTRHDLRARVDGGHFREDLFYRLDVLRVVVPPLRERREDVPLLLEHFCRRADAPIRFTPRALELLTAYPWPGNVRELENEVHRLVALQRGEIGAEHLSGDVREGRGGGAPVDGLAGRTLADVERAMIAAALQTEEGNKARAARRLGIPRSTLYGLIERYGL